MARNLTFTLVSVHSLSWRDPSKFSNRSKKIDHLVKLVVFPHRTKQFYWIGVFLHYGVGLGFQ